EINAQVFGHFTLEILLIIFLSLIAAVGLAFLLNRIEHHIKFVPIILLIVLIYCLSKAYHLPGLIFILIFGLFLTNIEKLKNLPFIRKMNHDVLDKELGKFKDLLTEGAFLIRSLFFLLFGYLIKTEELLNADTFIWSLFITICIFGLRYLTLKLFKLPILPLLFIAPRGLITILLFLSIEPFDTISIISQSLIIQVIILSAIIMMVGLIMNKPQPVSAENSEKT
ncbi:MAG TPA: sodium:proton antiporter, partial [Bacteroidia bacterium]